VPVELIVPVYLNQKIVFDLVAMMQGGIATVTKVTESFSDSVSESSTVGGTFGLSEALSTLFKVNLSGEFRDGKDKAAEKNTSEERIHTPASLFYELRNWMLREKMIIQGASTLPKPGDFIEVEASLSQSPMIIGLDAVLKIFELTDLFSSENNQQRKKGQSKSGGNYKDIKNHLAVLRNNLVEGNSRDLVAKAKSNEISVVLSVEEQFLNDKTMSDIEDGTFKVFGKVVRTVEDNSDSISLVRKSSLSNAPVLLEKVVESLDKMSQSGLSTPEMVSEIEGPAIQVLPIAIYT